MNITTKALIGTGIVVVLLLGLSLFFRHELQLALMTRLIHPSHAFSDAPSPPQPDYSNPDHWAALFDREDLADVVPKDTTDLQGVASADVFFIHPTTYFSRSTWNQSLDDVEINRFTDTMVIQGQASAYNACCRVYAPRYRQATLAAFFTDDDSGPQALALAYQDIVTAFRHFIERFNTERPFLLAAHSQGSHHADRLLAEEIVGTELENRLVAAYPIGFHIDGTNGLPICQTPTETGCQNSWNTVGPRAERLFTLPSSICVNPLTWLLDEVYADHNANLGAVNFESELGVGIEEGADRFDTIQPGVADAQCRDGRLHVSQIRSSQYSLMQLGRDNYHIYDYALFYINIRQNAQARVDAFCGANVLDCLLALRAPDWGNWTHIE